MGWVTKMALFSFLLLYNIDLFNVLHLFYKEICFLHHFVQPTSLSCSFLPSLQTQRDGLIFIYDMTNSSYSNFDYELCVKILNLLKVNMRNTLCCSQTFWY